MSKARAKSIAVILILVVSTLACKAVSTPIRDTLQMLANPTPTYTALPTPTPANPAATPTVSRETGSITITVTEAAANQAIAEELKTQSSPLITDPKLSLKKGEVILTGFMSADVIQANIVLSMGVQVNPEGQPEVKINSATLDGAPLPDNMLESLTIVANQMVATALASSAPGYKLTSIVIEDGYATISGVSP